MKTEEQREHNQELACLVDDIAFKASLLRIAEKALEDIRGLCVSSTYWNNPDYPNCARLLKQHHKIVSDAKVKAEEMRAIEYGDDVEVSIPAGRRWRYFTGCTKNKRYRRANRRSEAESELSAGLYIFGENHEQRPIQRMELSRSPRRL